MTTSKTAWQLKVLPASLSQFQGENGKLSSVPQKCTTAHEHMQTHIINKCNELFLNDTTEKT